MTEPTFVVLNTRLTDEQVAAIDKIAASKGQSRAAMIRWFIAEGIARFSLSARPTDKSTGTQDDCQPAELSAA